MVAQDHGAPDWWSCFLPSEWAQTWILYPLLAHSRCSGPACLSCRDEPWTLLGNGSPDERTRPQALYSKLLLLFLLATCLSLWAKANFNQSLSTSWGWSSFTKIFLSLCFPISGAQQTWGALKAGWGESLSKFKHLRCFPFCLTLEHNFPPSRWCYNESVGHQGRSFVIICTITPPLGSFLSFVTQVPE